MVLIVFALQGCLVYVPCYCSNAIAVEVIASRGISETCSTRIQNEIKISPDNVESFPTS
jgi:hypothetical protein